MQIGETHEYFDFNGQSPAEGQHGGACGVNKSVGKKGVGVMELEHILRNFLNESGRLTAFPAKRKMKIYCLFYLAQKVEANRDYTEREVGDLLLEWHTFADPATLRRELYDYHFLDRSRDGKIYRLSEKQPTLDEFGL